MITNTIYDSELVSIPQPDLVNIYDSEIGGGTKIGAFVEIGVSVIGMGCKIQAHAFIPPFTLIQDNVFIGPGVRCCNVNHPCPEDWYKGGKPDGPTIMHHATIGAGAIILPSVIIGAYAFIGAGSVVTHNCKPYGLYYGNPARYIGKVYERISNRD